MNKAMQLLILKGEICGLPTQRQLDVIKHFEFFQEYMIEHGADAKIAFAYLALELQEDD